MAGRNLDLDELNGRFQEHANGLHLPHWTIANRLCNYFRLARRLNRGHRPNWSTVFALVRRRLWRALSPQVRRRA